MHNIIINVLLILGGFSTLIADSEYKFPYILILSAVLLATIYNHYNSAYTTRFNKSTLLFSSVFSIMITVSNYTSFANISLFDNSTDFMIAVYRILRILLVSLSSLIGFTNLLNCTFYMFTTKSDSISLYLHQPIKINVKSRTVFLITFFSIVTVDFFFLIMCKYPGNLSIDSISQINQALTGSYTNHHPVFHTLIIRALLSIGLALFNDINCAIALYSIFQILFMAFCFAFSLSTCTEMGISNKLIIVLGFFYLLTPYNILFSFTIWKDVMFSGSVLLFITILYRLFNNIDNRKMNMALLFISSVNVCLLRSNGLFVFILVFMFFSIMHFKKHTNMFIAMTLALTLSLIFKFVILGALNIPQPDFAEKTSIPLQQIANAYIYSDDFEKEELAVLSQFMDLNQIEEEYDPHVSDPIKALVRNTGNHEYINNNKYEFLRLYLSVAIRHPILYIQAWIDQTGEYWNFGGRPFGIFDGIQDNELGITRITKMNWVSQLLTDYAKMFDELPILNFFSSIGLWFGIDLLLLFIAVIKENKNSIILTIPIIGLVLSLMIATPVNGEFRYVYSIFCSLPALTVFVINDVTMNNSERIEHA